MIALQSYRLLVLRVCRDEVAYPGGSGEQFPWGTSLYQFQVLLDSTVSICVHIHAAQVALYQWYQPWELPLLYKYKSNH